MLGEIGTLQWTRRTGGRLTRGERARYFAAVLAVQTRATPLLLASRLGWRSRRRASLEGVQVPDSKLAGEAVEACSELMPQTIVEHNHRSYLYAGAFAALDGIVHDREALYVATMFHDAGAMSPDTSDGGRCFTLAGAEQVERHLGDAGLGAELCEAAAEAVTLHVNPGVGLDHGPVAHLMHAGVLLDAVGMRSWQMSGGAIRTARERHPRMRFSQEGGRLLKAQADAIPACRIAAAFQAGFGLALKIGPWQD